MSIPKGSSYDISVDSAVGKSQSFVVITGDNIGENSNVLARAMDSYNGVLNKSSYSHSSRDRYKDIETNISVRDQHSRSDYDYFRPNERLPTKPKDIMSQCMEAYRKVGIVRNVIDLMSDFGTQGIKIVHPNNRQQRFYRAWFRKVNGAERTERALNYLYRCGIFVAKRHLAKLKYDEERKMKTAYSDKLEQDVEPTQQVRVGRRTIPIRYVFMNPLMLDALGEELGPFVGRQEYAIKVSNKLARLINNSLKSKGLNDLISGIPADILSAIHNGQRLIPLDSRKISVRHYKRDDWNVWADPMIYAILDELKDLEKMKLADRAALDSIISQIRLWKLGDLEKGIFPTDIAVNRLINILLSNPGGGAFDIVWGPELTFEETSTDVHEFLGDEKYTPVMNRIYAGLGVPPTLTGAATSSGFTNNYISLQTLIKRLEYGRMVVTSFWEEEIELVRQAMDFQRGARIEFDNQILSDEASMKKLFIQLADRDIISIDTLAERFNEDPEIEQLKIKREMKARKRGVMNDKAGPWHAPEKIHEYIKSSLPRGYLTLDLPNDEYPYINDVDTPFEKQLKSKTNTTNNSGQNDKNKKEKSTDGRPQGSKDDEKRQRNPKPLGASEDFLVACVWAKEALNKISKIITPAILQHFGKANQRSLSHGEIKGLENMKFGLLCSCPLFYDISKEDVLLALDNGQYNIDDNIKKVYNKLVKHTINKKGEEPTTDELRMLQVYAYALYNC